MSQLFGKDSNLCAFDVWSLTHMTWGAASGALGMHPWVFVGLSVAYEAIEYWHEWPRGSALFGSKRPESPVNIIGDLTAEFLTYLAARAARERLRDR